MLSSFIVQFVSQDSICTIYAIFLENQFYINIYIYITIFLKINKYFTYILMIFIDFIYLTS